MFDKNGDTEFFALSKSYIKPEKYKEYDEAVELYNELVKNRKNDE